MTGKDLAKGNQTLGWYISPM